MLIIMNFVPRLFPLQLLTADYLITIVERNAWQIFHVHWCI